MARLTVLMGLCLDLPKRVPDFQVVDPFMERQLFGLLMRLGIALTA